MSSRANSSQSIRDRLSHPDKTLYPKPGVTKADLAEHYAARADDILPHLKKRPLALRRYPDGLEGEGFYHKHLQKGFPDAVKTKTLKEESGSGSYGYITNLDGLVALAQMAALEIHVWNCRVDRQDRPDQLVFDLDPSKGMTKKRVAEAAKDLRDLLQQEAGLTSFLKATGGSGLHVVVPIRRSSIWEEAQSFSKAVAQTLQDSDPNRFTLSNKKEDRKGKVFIDYLRNARGAHAVVPFSTRASDDAPVAVPLSWDEANADCQPDGCTLKNLGHRLSQLNHDPWENFFELNQSITKKARRAVGAD